MKTLLTILFLTILLAPSLQAQKEDKRRAKQTYPIDSCLLFMDPFSMTVRQVQTFGNGFVGVRVRFESASTSNPDLLMIGSGRFMINSDMIPGGLDLSPGSSLLALLTLPDFVHDPDSPWLGQTIPFPVILSGFLMTAGNTSLNPPLSIALRTIRLDLISLVD